MEAGMHLTSMEHISRSLCCFVRLLVIGVVCRASLSFCLAAPPQSVLLAIQDGKLTGPGAEIIKGELAKAQFVLFGEDHGFADSPIILRAIAREARPLGFKYHVVEVGPLTTRIIRETLSRDGIPGVHKLVHEVPLGIPFLSLQNDAELASDFLGQDSKGNPFLWGIDQEFIGSPIFHLTHLARLAPNEAARKKVEDILAEEKTAAEKGAQDKFVLVRFHDQDFDNLGAEFKGQPEAQNIIAELKESAAIYQLWLSGHNYANNQRRAELLAKHFLAFYKSAAEAQPKILFKMGLEHVALGTTTVQTVDVGTLATSMARANGQTALRIAFLPIGGHNTAFAPKPGNPATVQLYENKEVQEFFASIGLDPGALSKESWTLVPLESVRQALDTKGIVALKPFSRFVLLGYDYVITTPDAKPGISLY
jgi:hypothetical protein